MADVNKGSGNRRSSTKQNGNGGTTGFGNGSFADGMSTAVVGRPIRVIVSVEPVVERSRVLDALSQFQGLDVHAVDHLDLQSIVVAPNYDYAIVWYQVLEKMRDADATALVRLSRSAKVIVALTSDRILDAAKVLHLADAWLFTDGFLDRLGLLVGLSDSGYTVIPSMIGNDFGLNGLRGELLNTLQPSERRVLGALGQGFTNRDIAAALNMSEPQTKAIVRSVLGKLRFRNRTEAAVFMARRQNSHTARMERRAS